MAVSIDTYDWSCPSCIHGHHVYKEIWQLFIGEELKCVRFGRLSGVPAVHQTSALAACIAAMACSLREGPLDLVKNTRASGSRAIIPLDVAKNRHTVTPCGGC